MNIFNTKKNRFTRLLPSVVALCAVVLALKTTGLIHDAYAQVSGQMAALTNDPVPANKDFAGGEDDQVASASQVDVVNSLSRRRHELDAQSAQLSTQTNMIAAAEQRVDAKITQLKQLQTQIAAMLGQRDKAQQDQIDSLIKTYSIMKAKDAARIFNNLPDEVLLPVAQKMKPDLLAQVLANMNADNAKTLTVKLAGMLTLPQNAGAPAPVTAAADPAAAQVASNPDAASDAEQPATPAPAVKSRARRPAPAKPAPEQQAIASPEARQAVQAASAPAAATPASAAPAAATSPKDTVLPKG
jgi:flagellar motility protein MotE (MotC chaperone)